MGAGGIIHQRASALLVAATEPCFFDSLPQTCKNKISAIDAKPFDQRTEHDLHTLVKMLEIALHC